MKVLIVSDTHKRNDNFFHVMEMVGPIDMVIHCGDIEGSEYAIEAGAGCPVEMMIFSPTFLWNGSLNSGNIRSGLPTDIIITSPWETRG